MVSEEGKIGAFKLREEVKDLPPGSFFFRKEQQDKEEKQVKPVVTAAAQARMASAAALKDDSASSSTVTKAPPPNVSSSPAKVLANVKVDVGHSAEPVDKPLAKVRAEPVDKPLAKVRAEPVDKPLAKVRVPVCHALPRSSHGVAHPMTAETSGRQDTTGQEGQR